MSTTDEQQIHQIVADWMAATRAGDTERVLGLMSDDVVFLTPGNPPMNKADFAKASSAQAASGMVIEGRSEIREVQVCGDWAFMWSQLSISVAPAHGSRMERAGHTLTVFRKQDGRWLLARDANMLAPVGNKPAQG